MKYHHCPTCPSLSFSPAPLFSSYNDLFILNKNNQILYNKTCVPSLPCKKTRQQPTPGPTGTQWLEDLFFHKQPEIPLQISIFDSNELTLPPFVEPSQPNEPPVPGLSQPSKPHADALNSFPATPASVIIIDNTPAGSHLPVPPPSTPTLEIPTTSCPHSYNEAQQEFRGLQLTLMIP
ncbi:hypothetical protein O181_099340 [Austropuccinia psidii MF-1]|uniref:Uncharacterized protein n=1 Tax=Austropuccinia psidii MF-1 TaxID=1389203 RepID=A0A9Q3PFT1_9BASI|nr:hypothetical protein [Austropuccinia psidii MF-1]